ncbi:MAG: amidohydrolase family protein [Armatimonadetes bacterium]|nr:amidohydrolase family protein [Armatimonadota bacterium]NIM22828.1 amidohydrolase family protein [Armatimonadota bacterium]NIM66695.1 amidohydrolase family protein [Armatimonadota bacterium]NIM75252.1 amidohydrolase family protein [Armatimonadota bacterium]NIN04893.1 amidohydrolase family protein [Armatimonadota bacterium]
MSLLIRNPTVVDGTGAPPRRADLAVEGDIITAVGKVSGSAKQIIDASGQFVAPGFIDIHSHTDHLLLANPLAESKLLQGVTCEVGGNCGVSAAPLEREHELTMAEALAPYGAQVDWQELDEFLTRLDKCRIGPNFATLVGHGNLRGRALGHESTEATLDEMDKMKEEAQRAFRQGAFGISAGLVYPPGCYADAEELTEVVGTARGHGFFSLHMRDEGAHLRESVEEALRICHHSRVPLHISHHKVTGEKNWGLVKDTVGKIEEARRAGLDVTADIYPYTATNTDLSVVLPDWVKQGGMKAMLSRLGDSTALERIKQDWGSRATDPEEWEGYIISRTFDMENKRKGLEGTRISEVCQAWRQTPLEIVVSLLRADEGRTEIIRFGISEEDIETVLQQPWTMVGSDAAAKDFKEEWGHPHPRGFGTFPRVLAEYVRERGILALQEAIRKMTSLPAWRLGLADRGRIAPGCKADLVVFDLSSIADKATYQQPLQAPQGITWVIVNGVVVAREGKLTGARPGMVLRAQ